MKIQRSALFKTLMLSHLAIFVPLAVVQAVVCLLGGTFNAPSEVQLPLGFSCSPPAEQMAALVAIGLQFATIVASRLLLRLDWS